MTKEILTQERLKELLSYNPDTGLFIRLIGRSGAGKVGSVAGGQSSNGYRRINVDMNEYLEHRLAWLYMYGNFPKKSIDHINHDKTDNRIENLRDVSIAENAKNYKGRADGQLIGVYWCNSTDKWAAHICANGIKYHLGRFYDWFEAVCARKSAECLHGFHHNHGGL